MYSFGVDPNHKEQAVRSACPAPSQLGSNEWDYIAPFNDMENRNPTRRSWIQITKSRQSGLPVQRHPSFGATSGITLLHSMTWRIVIPLVAPASKSQRAGSQVCPSSAIPASEQRVGLLCSVCLSHRPASDAFGFFYKRRAICVAVSMTSPARTPLSNLRKNATVRNVQLFINWHKR